MEADQRLRRAYKHAVAVGVRRATLVSYRDRWSALRSDALRDPGRTTRGYHAMAADLERLARRA